MEHLPYPNNGRYVLGAERERYAEIAAERYAAGASIQAIADELGRSRSFVNGLLHRDTDVEVRPHSVPGRRRATRN
ncbi:helix-turn-helix domain-containing protein [Streptomyces sp. NPDC005336]|uniref:helix-turn-helix domain-containing protein n=1 Tax=Streptomyces sp. NPDC005336 TaxID=3157035 RepID=UPI0033BF1687